MKDPVPHAVWNAAGLLLYMAGGALTLSSTPPPGWLTQAMVILGIGLLVYGVSRMAVHRGHHVAWGLAGLAGLLGLVIVWMLPDRAAPWRTR